MRTIVQDKARNIYTVDLLNICVMRWRETTTLWEVFIPRETLESISYHPYGVMLADAMYVYDLAYARGESQLRIRFQVAFAPDGSLIYEGKHALGIWSDDDPGKTEYDPV